MMITLSEQTRLHIENIRLKAERAEMELNNQRHAMRVLLESLSKEHGVDMFSAEINLDTGVVTPAPVESPDSVESYRMRLGCTGGMMLPHERHEHIGKTTAAPVRPSWRAVRVPKILRLHRVLSR